MKQIESSKQSTVNIIVDADKKKDCPCKRLSCERHGNCEQCRTYHSSHKYATACEQLQKKKTKSKTTKTTD